MGKRFLLTSILLSFLMGTAFAEDQYNIYIGPQSKQVNTASYTVPSSKYDYLYMNPPRQSLYVYGRYIMSSSKMRYVHSPSKLKREKHSERINANNKLYAYGY